MIATSAQHQSALRLHREAFVFDGLVAGPPSPTTVKRLLATGYSGANWTVGGHADSTTGALTKIATFYWLRDELPDLVHLVQTGADFDDPALDTKLRVVMGFQGTEPLGKEFHFVSIFHALGVRIIQLTYNDANALGNGCLETADHGLTHFGLEVVREMNRLGMLIDVTHAGVKTGLDAIAESADPVVFSHSSVRAIRDNPRNLTDEQMRAVADRGGVVGIASFADFVGDTTLGQPTMEQYLDHISYAVELIGIDHVGIGTDIFETAGAAGIWWNANTKRRYPEICGAMDEQMHGIAGFDRWENFVDVTEGLLRRGFSEAEARKIIGGNFRRVLRSVLR